MNFADKLQQSITRNKSFTCSGFDPVIDQFPPFLLEKIASSTTTTEDFVYEALTRFFFTAIKALKDRAACIKPNIAFYEQYGIAGIRAFASISAFASENGLPVIADVKRGDIGSTAQAYSAAFLTGSKAAGRVIAPFAADAITISPFLGFDTLEVFLKAASESGKGLFILVRTSNPGSVDLQTVKDVEGRDISERIADWIGAKASVLQGTCGYSGVGAVVGATSPDIGRELRKKMPANFLLIPGYGAQGAGAKDAVAAFDSKGGGAVINASRSLLGGFDASVNSFESLEAAIKARAEAMNNDIAAALV